jgi:branched-chain amino acid transport system substrate-binding protein
MRTTPRRHWWLATAALLIAAGLAGVAAPPAGAQEKIRVGVVTLLSGPFAASIGVPARHGAEMVAEAINGGTLPAPYGSKGVAGRQVELVVIDEATPTSKQVTEFRGLAERRDVDVVIGYLVAGNCIAVAPVADELKMLTFFSTCSTPRIFEDGEYRYVYRTSAHLTPDSVAMARYLLKRMPNVKTFAGLNWNTAYGQDAWRDFRLSLQALKPDVEAVNEQFTTFGGGQYGSEISVLLAKKPQLLHTAFAGGDFEAFVFQMVPRGLHQQMVMAMTAGAGSIFRLGDKLPDGVIIADRGPYSAFARPTPLGNWFRGTYEKKHGTTPPYTAYHMGQALLALKTTADKVAAAKGGAKPTPEEIGKALEGLKFEAFGTTVEMSRSKGHQGVTESAVGIYKFDRAKNQPTVTDVVYYPADCVFPPEGLKSADWITGGFKGARCE